MRLAESSTVFGDAAEAEEVEVVMMTEKDGLQWAHPSAGTCSCLLSVPFFLSEVVSGSNSGRDIGMLFFDKRDDWILRRLPRKELSRPWL
jgi:hypothetical protein